MIISLVIISILAYFVMAAAGDSVKIVSPASGTNYTSITSIQFNVSFVNGTDIIQPSNATFFLNISGVWSAIGSTSATNGCQVGATTSSCSTTLTNTTISDGIYAVNATIYNGTGVSRTSVTQISNLSTIIIDSTRPVVFPQNFTTVSSWANYSGFLTINLSAFDLLVGIQNVVFNFTNSSGQQNATIAATREGTANSYVLTINTSHYVQGMINITAFVNDSLNNLNNSAKVFQLLFDNIAPYGSYTCSDYTVEEDDVMSCTCSSSDSGGAGVNSTSYTSSPSTANTGNNKQDTCTVVDTAGNTNTTTIYYNVTSGSSGGSSSSSSSGSSSTRSSSNNSSSSSSSTNSTNSTVQNSSSEVNQLEGNQEDQNGQNLKINYWVLGIIALVCALIVATVILVKKGIIQKILKFNK